MSPLFFLPYYFIKIQSYFQLFPSKYANTVHIRQNHPSGLDK